ncbi:MAG: hypothetical protein CMH26_05070 [Micavibrio sp.]|nr:hypothetical protein [Micavibrio sp.]|tara:strand:- start:208 stop:1575 length:1368 start_codon:yes stop_codon:yes gene_type:complete
MAPPDKSEIIFLIRAYNDMDIQMSLVHEFAKDERFNIRVIGYPCDGDMGSPQSHEAARYMYDKYGVSFETVLDKAPAPFHLRLMYKFERFIAPLRHKSWADNIVVGSVLKTLHLAVLVPMRKMLKGELPWLDKIAESWDPVFINCDEAVLQKGRAYILDKYVSSMSARGVHVYAIQTGQTAYYDASPNKASIEVSENMKTLQCLKGCVHRFTVPAKLDSDVVRERSPNLKPEVHGNLRMDRSWIKRLHEEILVPPYMNKKAYMDKLPQGKGPKVVFMLSKLGYGIKVDELKDSIKLVADMPGVSCAIKPHTRGMKFDFMDPKQLSDTVIVPDIPSALLIEWADILLFTGSSIAFHAMILNKRVGFLQNAQYIPTIFDDGLSCDKFDTNEQLQAFLENWRDNGEPEVDAETLKARHKWQADNIHGGLESGLTAQHYKDLYLGDLKVLKNPHQRKVS